MRATQRSRLAAGPLSVWQHNGTWTLNGGLWTNAPTVGAELLANGAFASDTGWTKGAGWTIAGGVGVATTVTAGIGISQASILTIGNWYHQQFDIPTLTANGLSPWDGNALVNQTATTTGNAKLWSLRAAGTTAGIFARVGATSGTIDNASIKPLTTNTLFIARPGIADPPTIGAWLTIVANTHCGVVVNLDSIVTPANFVIGLHNGATASMFKCVAGVYTSLVSAGATYVAGARLEVRKTAPTTYQLWYNGAQVGTNQTVSDAGIISNTLHGGVSMYSGNILRI